MRLTKKEKTRRTALLTAQNNTCALCKAQHSTATGMIHSREQNAMICRNCAQFKTVIEFNAKRGLTPAHLTAFLNREPAPEPAPIRPAKRLTSSQLQGLQAVLDGRVPGVTVADWCERAGVTEAEAMRQHRQG